MSLFTSILVFVIIWWTVFFAVLPWGVRRTQEPAEGHDAGAPVHPQLWMKVLATTVISALIFAGVYWVIESGLIDFRR